MPFTNADRRQLDDVWKLLTGKVLPMLDALKAEVARNREVDVAAKALIEGIALKLDELANQPNVDPAEITALADDLRTSSDTLAAAVVANTPAA